MPSSGAENSGVSKVQQSNIRWPVQKAQGGWCGWRRAREQGREAGNGVREVSGALWVSSGVLGPVGRGSCGV